ncbi:MAG TPA: hypothetical protein VGJ28_14340 [Micromonosporaceae bacterium]
MAHSRYPESDPDPRAHPGGSPDLRRQPPPDIPQQRTVYTAASYSPQQHYPQAHYAEPYAGGRADYQPDRMSSGMRLFMIVLGIALVIALAVIALLLLTFHNGSSNQLPTLPATTPTVFTL